MPSGLAQPRGGSRQSQISGARSTSTRTGRSPSSSSRPIASSGSATRRRLSGIDVAIVPGILPVANVAQTRRFASYVRSQHFSLDQPSARWPRRMPGVSACRRYPGSRALWATLCGGRAPLPFYTLNRADLSYLPPPWSQAYRGSQGALRCCLSADPGRMLRLATGQAAEKYAKSSTRRGRSGRLVGHPVPWRRYRP